MFDTCWMMMMILFKLTIAVVRVSRHDKINYFQLIFRNSFKIKFFIVKILACTL